MYFSCFQIVRKAEDFRLVQTEIDTNHFLAVHDNDSKAETFHSLQN
jgi:hypothetical protein